MVRNSPGLALVVIWWRLRYAFYMRKRLHETVSLKFCWNSSGAYIDILLCDDMDGLTPKEAVDDELSYWTD